MIDPAMHCMSWADVQSAGAWRPAARIVILTVLTRPGRGKGPSWDRCNVFSVIWMPTLSPNATQNTSIPVHTQVRKRDAFRGKSGWTAGYQFGQRGSQVILRDLVR